MKCYNDYGKFMKDVKKYFPNAKDYPTKNIEFKYIFLHINLDFKMTDILNKWIKYSDKNLNDILPVYCRYNSDSCERCHKKSECKKIIDRFERKLKIKRIWKKEK